MNAAQIRTVQLVGDETAIVNTLVSAYAALFASIDAAQGESDALVKSALKLDVAARKAWAKVAERDLCQQVGSSMRRGELIAVAQTLADAGSWAGAQADEPQDQGQGYGIFSAEGLLERDEEEAAI